MNATATIPARPQHMRALDRANEIRLARAELKRRVAFGKVDVVPTVVVLNRKGVEVWRKEAAPAPHELESVLDDAAR